MARRREDEQLYFSVISLGEILKGVTRLPESRRRTELQLWLDNTLRPWFAGRILPVTEQIAERWGMLAGQSLLGGKTIKVADGLIAATALHHDLTIVTRNVKDFEYLGVKLLNPWESRSSLQKCAILNAAEVDPHPSFRYRQWLADSLQNY